MKCDKHKTNDLTPNEVSLILNKNYRTILRWIKEGKFKDVHTCEFCGASLIPSSAIDAYIESLKTTF